MVDCEFVTGLSIVNFRVARGHAGEAVESLGLAAPLSRTTGDPASLWLGPDNWLLISDRQSVDDMTTSYKERLAGLTWNATDSTDALFTLRISGGSVRELLSSGSGLDFRSQQFPVGACKRTRLAQIPITISAMQESAFELLFDRSYKGYLEDWLLTSVEIVEAAAK